ncbi:MAG: hypothetical protein ABW065_06645 [Solirubrobacterales bacterium]
MPAPGKADSVQDVVVVVPGIMGTRLSRHGEPVWALSGGALWNGLKSLGKSIQALELPADIGDEHPGDGVELAGLMPDLHGLPGLGPFVGGYSDLTRWLRENLGLVEAKDGRPGNLVEFGYDWRLSNRYNATQLKEVATDALRAWRRDGHEAAKLVFFCHSMGGLVARYYLEVLGGLEETRSLITVGTPHQGSLKALDNLVNGRRIGIGPFGLDVAALARSFPSSHQLLPIYRCIERDGKLLNLADAPPPRLEPAMVADARRFHAEIGDAIAGEAERPYGLRTIVGTRQPTLASARIDGDRVETLLTIDGDEELGDGTVPRFASIPAELKGTDLRQLSSGKRHGWLQQSQGVLDDFQGILTARDVIFMASETEVELDAGIEVPEVVAPDEELCIRAQNGDDRLLLLATLRDADGTIEGAPVALENHGGGSYEVRFGPVAEGAYTVTVENPRAGPVEPVVEAVLVAPTEVGD